MREEIKMLIQLQELDATVRRLKQTKEKLAKEAAEVDRAAQAEKQTLTDKSSEAKSFRMALDKRELDLKEVEGRIKKLEVQLNTVKSNKEYAAFQHEILGLKADKSRIEDEILKMFEQSEQQQKEIKQLAAKAEDAAAAVSERKKAIQTALQDADARVERVQKERTELSAKIPPAFRNPYERLLTAGRRPRDGRLPQLRLQRLPDVAHRQHRQPAHGRRQADLLPVLRPHPLPRRGRGPHRRRRRGTKRFVVSGADNAYRRKPAPGIPTAS